MTPARRNVEGVNNARVVEWGECDDVDAYGWCRWFIKMASIALMGTIVDHIVILFGKYHHRVRYITIITVK
jgi:hypothetical protein